MSYIILTVLFSSATAKFHLPSGLLESLCMVESNHNIAAVHKDDGDADSLGICQIKLATARELGFKGTAKQLMKPDININYAAKYLDFQRRRYHGSITKAIIAYNKGNAKQLTRTIYSDKVITQWRMIADE